MNFVEVDASGLKDALLDAIIKRSLSISCGKPVIVIVDGELAAEQAKKLAETKKRSVKTEILPDGKIKLKMTAAAF
jgi:predicted carbohydrate-binding protein with CBM5 and CBM33 domain